MFIRPSNHSWYIYISLRCTSAYLFCGISKRFSLYFFFVLFGSCSKIRRLLSIFTIRFCTKKLFYFCGQYTSFIHKFSFFATLLAEAALVAFLIWSGSSTLFIQDYGFPCSIVTNPKFRPLYFRFVRWTILQVEKIPEYISINCLLCISQDLR